MMVLCGVWAIRVGLDLRFPEGTNFPVWKVLGSGNHFCPGLQGGSQLELTEIGKAAFANHLPNQKKTFTKKWVSQNNCRLRGFAPGLTQIDTSVTPAFITI